MMVAGWGPGIRGTTALITGLVLVGAGGTQARAAEPADALLLPVAVGVPNVPNQDGGVVDLRLTTGNEQFLTRGGLTGFTPAGAVLGAAFGAAVAIGDLNADGLPDAVIGAPGDSSAAGLALAGEVFVVPGKAGGFFGAEAVRLTPPAAKAGDRFGAAITLVNHYDYDTGEARIGEIVIGAPGTTVAGQADAGAVYRYAVAEDGAVTADGMLTQNTPASTDPDSSFRGIPGSAETGDEFGSVLAPGATRFFVGVPKEDVGTAKDAGATVTVNITYGGEIYEAHARSQASSGIPGHPEAGDNFGASIAAGGYAIGVPGEDVGSIKDAGLAHLFGLPSEEGDDSPHRRTVTQDSAGIPGRAEAGDRFGAAVTAGYFDDCGGRLQAAVAAPREDIGDARDAGSVIRIQVDTRVSEPCRPRALAQGTGLNGVPETGDRLGTTLQVVRGAEPFDADGRYVGPDDTLIVGIPGEDVGQVDVGRVTTWKPGSAVGFGYDSDVRGLAYGSVLGSYTNP